MLSAVNGAARRGSRRTTIAAALAVALHSAVLFVVAVRAHPRPPTDDGRPEAPEELSEVPLELAFDQAVDGRRVSVETASSAEGVAGAVVGLAGHGIDRRVATVATAEAASGTPATAASALGPEPAGSGAAPVLTMPSPADIGLAGPNGMNPFFRPSMAPDVSRGESGQAAAGSALRQALHEQDAKRGLGPEGPLLRSLEEATHSGFGPERGSAVFSARIDEHGFLVDLRVLATGGAAAWVDVSERTKKALDGKPLALRGAKGAELTIRVTSDVVLPSGSKGPIPPTLQQAPVGLNGPASSPGSTADVVNTYEMGRFDLADIKAKPTRVVHARLESFKAF